MEGFDIQRLMAGGVLVTIVVAMWNKIKATWHHATGFLIKRMILNGDAKSPVLNYLVQKGKMSKIRDLEIRTYSQQLKVGHYEQVLFEELGSKPMVVWYDGWPMLLTGVVEKKDKNGQFVDITSLTIVSFRGTIDYDKLLFESAKLFNEMNIASWNLTASKKRRFFIRAVPVKKSKDETGQLSSGNTVGGMEWFQSQRNRLISHVPEQLGNALSTTGKALDNLFFPEHIEKLQHEIILWRSKRDWYRAKGLPWKRGWLFYGPPGTGKTALARAFAEDLDMPIFVFNLADMSNYNLQSYWSKMQQHTPCIALIEDIDGVFHGRKNVAAHMFGPNPYGQDDSDITDPEDNKAPTGTPKKKKDDDHGYGGGMRQPLAFNTLLNVIDGVERLEGVFLIITTNDITKIDEAIGKPTGDNESTRPGRIDRVIELTYMTQTDKKRMAYRVLKDYPAHLKELTDAVDAEVDPPPTTPSQFQERCAQVALKILWEEEAAERKAKLDEEERQRA